MSKKLKKKKVKKPSLEDYKVSVDAVLKDIYGVSWQEASGDDDILDSFRLEFSAEAFVAWWGQKYDLVPKKELGLGAK